MVPEFHQNAIITGYIDSFCLACECYLRSDEDARRHIEKPVHKKNLDSTQFVEKYKDDHIRKVKSGYYCEFCNVLLFTITKIGIHVTDAKHIARKGELLLKAQGNGVVAYKNILIKLKAWHSMTEDTCAICNTEFENADIHKNDATHLLKLVQNKVEFGANNSLYRRIDNSTFQCLTCNVVLALSTIEQHFNDPDHHNVYLNCRILQNDIKDEKQVPNKRNDNENIMKNVTIDSSKKAPVAPKAEIKGKAKQPDKVKANTIKSETDTENNKSQILDSVSRFQKNEININFETETAFCKKCFVSIRFDFHDIEKHIEEHKTCKKSATHPLNVNQNHNKTMLMRNQETPMCSKQIDKEIKALPHKTDTDQNQNDINSQTNKEEVMETICTKAAGSHENSSTDDDDDYTDINDSDGDDEMANKDESENDTSIEFAKQNHITYNTKLRTAYCRVCKNKMPSSLRSMKEHVNGGPHKSRVASQAASTANTKLLKKKTKSFITDVTAVREFYYYDIVINDKFCVSKLSFLMISKHGSNLRCQACEVSLSLEEVDEHEETNNHKIAMMETPVVTCYDTEFVREIRPGLFHCGYCNLIAGCWSDFEKHIKCPEHIISKRSANMRLRSHMPGIIEHRQEREIDFLRLMMLGQFGRRF